MTPGDYLTGTYGKWLVEVDAASGDRPDTSLTTFLHDHLAPLVNKPNGVAFYNDDALTSTDASWSDSQIEDFASAHSSFSTGGDQVVTHLMFLAGHYAGDSGSAKVLGVTYDYDLIVIFPQTIKSTCTLQNLCTDSGSILRAATLHEFGHALGLVNRGTDMVHPHEDASHAGHSTNNKSVMYWAVESSDIVNLLTTGGTIPQDFDSSDKEDLHHAGGL